MAFKDSLIFTSDDLVNALVKQDTKKLKAYFKDMKVKFEPVWEQVTGLANKPENRWMTQSNPYKRLAQFSSFNQDSYVKELETQVIQLYNLVGNLTEVIQRMENDIESQANLLNLTTDQYKEALNFMNDNLDPDDIRKKFWKLFREEYDEYQKMGKPYDSEEINNYFSKATAADFFENSTGYIEKMLKDLAPRDKKKDLKGEF